MFRNIQTRMILLAALVAGIPLCPASAAEPVVVLLKPKANVGSRIVRIEHIAEVDGGTPELRERILNLDLATSPQPGASQTISQTQVQIRLLLDDIGFDACEVRGEKRVDVTRSTRAIDDEQIVDALSGPLANRLGVREEDLKVRLAQPLPENLGIDLAEPDQIRIEPFLPETTTIGRLRPTVGIYVQNRLVRTIPVTVEVQVFRTVARVNSDVAQGDVLSSENVRFERLAVATETANYADETVLGSKTSHAVRAGSVLRTSDIAVAAPAAVAELPILVRPRSVVRMIARKGSLSVVVNTGEVLQQGRLGDLVRVRNIQSSQVVVGRVISSSEVEIPF